MDELEKMFVRAYNDCKRISMKPKKSVVFSFSLSDVKDSKPLIKEYRNVKYFYLPCVIKLLDGSKVVGVKHYLQLTLKRDFIALYIFLKDNNLLDEDVVELEAHISLNNTYYTLLH